MQKKFNIYITMVIPITIIGIIIGCFMWSVTGASDTDTIGATVSATNLSLSVSDGNIAYGNVALDTATTTVDHGETQIVTNEGSDMKLNVKSSNASNGTGWTLAAAPGENLFKHEVSTTTGSSYMAFVDDSTYLTASSTMASGAATQNLDFQLTTPTISADFVEKSITITVQAVVQD